MVFEGNFYLKVTLSIIVVSIPWYIALVACVIRYFSIRNDGINRITRYSRLTRSKLTLCYAIAAMYILPIPMSLLVETYWLYQRWYFSFLYLIYTFTWVFLGLLIQMEHTRNLNNEWYWHKMFWILNPIFILIMSITVIIVDRFPNDIFDYVFMSLELITSLIAFSFMMKTKKKQIVVPPKRGSLRGRVLDSHPNTVDNDRPVSYTHLTLPTICSV